MPPDKSDIRAAPAGGAPIEDIYDRVQAISRENERILRDLIAGESRFRRLAKAVWQVQEDERRRLARELHDGIGQTLTALKNHLEWQAGEGRAAPVGSELGEAIDLASRALEDTRELSRLLRPPVLDDLGLAAALRWLGRSVSKRHHLDVLVDAGELEPRLPAEMETVFFRIAQEALNNAVKHAGARSVSIRLVNRGAEVELSVADDGVGFDSKKLTKTDDSTGVGLRGMKDRVELFAGRLDVRSTVGDGSEIVARLPIDREGSS